MAEVKVKRTETSRLVKAAVTNHWNNIRQAHAEGRPIAWGAGGMLLLTDAMDIPTHFMGGYGAFCAGTGGGTMLLKAAEDAKFLPETCSYHRIHLGDIHLIKQGALPEERWYLPPPDLITLVRLCPEHSHYAEALYRQFKVPVISVEVPSLVSEDEFDYAVDFVEKQFWAAIPEVEKFCGKPFRWDRLSQILQWIKDAGTYRKECWDLAKNIPAPCTMMDFSASHGMILYGFGPHQVEFFRKLKEELEQRVAQGIAAVPGEKYRLMWDSIIPWHNLRLLPSRMAATKTNFLMGRYIHEMIPHPELLDPEHPLHTIAEQNVRYWCPIMLPSSSPTGGATWVANAIKDYHIDGLVMHNIRTCRIYTIGQQDVAMEMDERFNVPYVIIEGDMADPQFFSEAQFDTRLQALLETIDARRAEGIERP